MRKSIFDIVSETIDIPGDVQRLYYLTYQLKIIDDTYMHKTVFEYVADHCFGSWSKRGHFVELKDFQDAFSFNEVVAKAKDGDTEAFIVYLEYIYNLWRLAHWAFTCRAIKHRTNDFDLIKRIIDDNLANLNHKVYTQNDYLILVEDKPEVTAVAEIVEQTLAFDIIRYNHRALKGNIEQKRSILLKMGNALEPRQNALIRLNSSLKSDISCLLNNLNIRHNNCDKQDRSNYKECVAKMPASELEEWYDELYQMMLLAFLQLDNIERTQKVAELKSQFGG